MLQGRRVGLPGTLATVLLAFAWPGPLAAQVEPGTGGIAGPDGRLREGLVVRGLGGVQPSVDWRGTLVRVEVGGEVCTAVQRETPPGGPAPEPIVLSRVEELEVLMSAGRSERRSGQAGPEEGWVRVRLASFLAREPAACRAAGVGRDWPSERPRESLTRADP